LCLILAIVFSKNLKPNAAEMLREKGGGGGGRDAERKIKERERERNEK
jgi:hypothetical protein